VDPNIHDKVCSLLRDSDIIANEYRQMFKYWMYQAH
jgi:hypothetical protein